MLTLLKLLKVTASELKQGQYIRYKNMTSLIQSTTHSHVARGGALIKINLQQINKKQQTMTVRPQEVIEVVELEWIKSEILYKDKETVSIEVDGDFQSIPLELIPNSDFVDSGMTIQFGLQDGEIITAKLPQTHTYKVTGINSDGVVARTKGTTLVKATLSSGASLKVPSFVKVNDSVEVSLKDFEYRKRI